MGKLCIIAGHGAGDPGALGNGYQEAERVRALANTIKKAGGDNVILADTNRNYYDDGGISTMSLPIDTELLELHLDSAGAEARGGHVIINPIYDADTFDVELSKYIAEKFPGRAGTLRKQPLSNADRAAAKGFPYRLLECCFITSANDMAKFNSDITDFANGILNVYGISGGKVSTPSLPKPIPTPTPQSWILIPQTGTFKCKTVEGLFVRSAPITGEDSKTGNSYLYDQRLYYDSYVDWDGIRWVSYIGYTGQRRYVARKKLDGSVVYGEYY